MFRKPVFFVFFVFIGFYGYAQTEQELVAKAFDNYKKAILEGKGEEAVKYVDSRTINYYNRMAYIIKYGDSVHVNELPVVDKITVLSVRARATKAEIMPLDGKGLMIYAINKGMIAKNSVSTNTLGQVSIEKDFAKAIVIIKGNATPYFMNFYNENGQWKADITSLFEIAGPAFDNMITASRMDENEFILSVLERMLGKRPGPEVWKPMNK